MGTTKEKKNTKKTFLMVGILAAVTIVAVIIFCVERTNFYKTHFLPNTYINGMNCSELDAETVADMLEEETKEYELVILGRDEAGTQKELGTVSAEEIALTLQDGLAEAKELLNQQKPEGWFMAVFGKEEQHFSLVHGVVFDEKKLENSVKKLDAFQEENMAAPVDAYISEYNEALNACEIVPEVMGTQLDVDLALSCIKAMISGGAAEVNLEEQNCYESPKVMADNKELMADLEQVNQWLGAKITYDWNTFEVVVDGNLIKDWIVLEEDGPKLDEDAVAAFVAKNASEYDTYGKKRKFTTTLGVEVSLPTGGFGWKTDRSAVKKELLAMIEDGAVKSVEPVYSNTAPVHGMNDIGSSYVEVDLSNQHLYLYHKGQLVFETDFVSGTMNSTPDCVTPAGVFDITYKTKNAVLRGSDYETPVSYWMPFYGNYGMHDATWRAEFGGDIFMTNGSHGCINLPLDSAAVIYNYMYEGHPVICYYY